MQDLAMTDGGEVESVVEVVESTWTLTREEGELELESSGREPAQSYLVDLTQQFDRIFVQNTFNSFREFEDLFSKFKAETGTVFRIKSSCSVAYENSRRKKHFVPSRFKFVSVRYCCVHFGQPKIAGQGIRTKQRYLPCGCECMLSLSYNRGALIISQVAMQHNHEVSSQMAPYYAINRRISNTELRQVADMIESMTNSRALQQFLQNQFHRQTTLQDAKNIRARLKALKMHKEASSCAVKSIKLDPELKEERYWEDKEDKEGGDVDDNDAEDDVIEQIDQGELFPHDEQNHSQQERQEQLREVVTNELQEKLSDLLSNCETSVFLNRINIINKIIKCWENGDHFDIHYASENGYSTEVEGGGSNQMSESTVESSVLPKGTTKAVTGTKASTTVGSSSDNCTDLILPVLNNTSVQLLPSSINGGPLKLAPPHKNNIASTLQVSKQQSFNKKPKKHVIGLHINLENCQLHEETGQEQCTKIHRKGYMMDMYEEIMEVEIEVNGDVANVKNVKLEPLECHEVDVT